MISLNIKPLSVNEAWQGKRFKTQKYKKYCDDVFMMLPKLTIPDGKLSVDLVFGLSSKNADIDNPVKCFIDCLQKKYGFNDSQIYELYVIKDDVDKGCEYVSFCVKRHKE